jgi:formate dehydrogenase subunit gamma
MASIVVKGNRRALRQTAHELRKLQSEDHEWINAIPARVFKGAPEPTPAGRFNAGQKINFILVYILFVVLYISGGDAIFVGRHHNFIFGFHGIAVIILCFLVAGHIYMSVVNRSTRHALRGMLTGKVDREWARKHYPRWKP